MVWKAAWRKNLDHKYFEAIGISSYNIQNLSAIRALFGHNDTPVALLGWLAYLKYSYDSIVTL